MHVAALDKIRVSESTTRNPKPKPKKPHSRWWVYQCKCWFGLASGSDWRSLGGEGKITWSVIAHKSRVEKQKKLCPDQWFFLVNFRTVATNVFLKKLDFIFLRVWIQEKNEKNDKVYKPQNWKRKGKKKHWYKGICVCALNKLWKNMLWN
jgi:hypothetical protein